MKRQTKSHYCGIASIANALEVLGIRRSQREVARLCHVTPEDGTDEVEMMRALLANGVQVDNYAGVDIDPWSWLNTHLYYHGPAILCVDDDEHWCTAIGRCGDRVLVFDPSRNCGVEVHDRKRLLRRWENSDEVCYGLGVRL